MLAKTIDLLRVPFVTAYEGGEAEGVSGEAEKVEEVVEPLRTQKEITEEVEKKKVVEPGQAKKVFTQADLDRVVRERLGREQEKHREKQSELLSRLESLEQTAQLTDEERSALQQRIEELRNENLSSEEKASREIKRTQEELDSLKTQLSEDIVIWQKRYFDFRIDNELMDAALTSDARTPAQLVSLLKQQTAVKEVVDDKGRSTGRFEVRTTITDYKEDGTPFQIDKKPHEAVARLAEMPEIWGNQFNSKVSAGLDRMSDQSTPVASGTGLILDKGYDAYLASRQKNKGLVKKRG